MRCSYLSNLELYLKCSMELLKSKGGSRSNKSAYT